MRIHRLGLFAALACIPLAACVPDYGPGYATGYPGGGYGYAPGPVAVAPVVEGGGYYAERPSYGYDGYASYGGGYGGGYRGGYGGYGGGRPDDDRRFRQDQRPDQGVVARQQQYNQALLAQQNAYNQATLARQNAYNQAVVARQQAAQSQRPPPARAGAQPFEDHSR